MLYRTLPYKEFVTLMALMMSIVALSIDAVLPALDVIGLAMGVEDANDNQLLVAILFAGLALGQLIFGPVSDVIGRRPTMVIGYCIFFFGSLLAFVVISYEGMLVSRFLQGIVVAAPRVLSMAIIRDLYEGRRMASVMSYIMMVFIAVPMLAPILGQFILSVAGWKMIFVVIFLTGFISLVWFWLRQAETLLVSDRASVSMSSIRHALVIMLQHRAVLGFTLASGFVSGPFIFYLSSAQQLFQQVYQLGDLFPFYFALLAFSIGLSSYVNGRRVESVGMHRTVFVALSVMTLASLLFSLVVWYFNGLPSLWLTSGYMLMVFFCLGLLFGNLNALAMEPLGHIAGMGAAVVGSVSTLLSVVLGIVIGQFFNETLYPLVISFALVGVIAMIIMRWVGKD